MTDPMTMAELDAEWRDLGNDPDIIALRPLLRARIDLLRAQERRLSNKQCEELTAKLDDALSELARRPTEPA